MIIYAIAVCFIYTLFIRASATLLSPDGWYVIERLVVCLYYGSYCRIPLACMIYLQQFRR